MTPNIRRLHWFAIGFQLAAIVLFVWLGLYFFVGWSAVFGAISSAQLWADRKRKGVAV